MKVFLTGGTGFIGGAVARALRRRGDEVVALVRTPSKAGELAQRGVELVEGDLGDVAAIERGMQGAGAVTAAQPSTRCAICSRPTSPMPRSPGPTRSTAGT